MELTIKLPNGAELHFKRKRMDWDRFVAICWLIGIGLVGYGILKFFAMMV